MRFMVVALTACVALAWVGIQVVERRHRAVALGYEIVEARAEQTRLDDQLRQLEIDRAALLSPERLGMVARNAGLRAPHGDEVVRVTTPRREAR